MQSIRLASAPAAAAPTPGQAPARRRTDGSTQLRAIVDRLQAATSGTQELDALIQDALPCLPPLLGASFVPRAARWSSEVGAAISLLSADYNFSVGQRDGISWAWIQPNDDWQPGEHESRHDHPAGSGLVVAYTAALALIAATFILCATRLERSEPTLAGE